MSLGTSDLTAIILAREGIGPYITRKLKNGSELDAINVELEADILRTIPDKSSLVYETSINGECKVVS